MEFFRSRSDGTRGKEAPDHPKIDVYDEYATAYAAYASDREGKEIKDDLFLSLFLDVIGDVSGLSVLDAGCGEGYLGRTQQAGSPTRSPI